MAPRSLEILCHLHPEQPFKCAWLDKQVSRGLASAQTWPRHGCHRLTSLSLVNPHVPRFQQKTHPSSQASAHWAPKPEWGAQPGCELTLLPPPASLALLPVNYTRGWHQYAGVSQVSLATFNLASVLQAAKQPCPCSPRLRHLCRLFLVQCGPGDKTTHLQPDLGPP